MRIFRLQQKLKVPTQNYIKILPADFLFIHEDRQTNRPVETIDLFFFNIQLRSHNICVLSEDDQPIRAQQYQAYNPLFKRTYLRIFVL